MEGDFLLLTATFGFNPLEFGVTMLMADDFLLKEKRISEKVNIDNKRNKIKLTFFFAVEEGRTMLWSANLTVIGATLSFMLSFLSLESLEDLVLAILKGSRKSEYPISRKNDIRKRYLPSMTT